MRSSVHTGTVTPVQSRTLMRNPEFCLKLCQNLHWYSARQREGIRQITHCVWTASNEPEKISNYRIPHFLISHASWSWHHVKVEKIKKKSNILTKNKIGRWNGKNSPNTSQFGLSMHVDLHFCPLWTQKQHKKTDGFCASCNPQCSSFRSPALRYFLVTYQWSSLNIRWSQKVWLYHYHLSYILFLPYHTRGLEF